ncbi:MAG: hypothetical protein EPN21_10970 [Methylococcaceae bacterium]|nr:MAG: hypothetical protein EPN21_10970 [Methylococcaceae bacterium]
MIEYKIFPAIGVARVGNAPEQFYIGPETYRGLPINPDGAPFTEQNFRDDEHRMCRQAARFRVYRVEDGVVKEEVTLATPGIKSIAWSAHLANKKPSWYTFETSLGETGYAPNHPLRNAHVTGADRQKLIIDAGPRHIEGSNQSGVCFDPASKPPHYHGAHFPQGKLKPVDEAITTLGELRTDAEGRLLVLGGYGISGTTDKKVKIGNYANNDNWWDDTSDGPVGARITLADGTSVDASPAWVLVGPPSYAPEIPNLVTLYDTIYDAMVQAGHYPDIFAHGYWNTGPQGYLPNFSSDIQPLLERGDLYTWVAAIPSKPHTFDFNRLGAIGPDGRGAQELQGLRQYILSFLRPPDQENRIIGKNGATMMPYLAGDNCLKLLHEPSKYLRLTDTQFFFLQQWAEGWFVDHESAAEPGQDLTRAVLENCVGGAFSPGIEMTWISRNPAIYAEPFRIRAHFVADGPLSLDFNPERGMEPGDVTRYMAVPWQADFNECSSQPLDGRTLWWWPAQRPEFVYLEPKRDQGKKAPGAGVPPSPNAQTGTQVAWLGTDFDQMGSDFIMFADDVDMVKYWSKLGFVMEKEIEVENKREERVEKKRLFVEVERELQRPFIPGDSES